MSDGTTRLDEAYIEELRSARCGGSEAFLREMLEIFLNDAPVSLGRIREAAARLDHDTLASAAHLLKGSSGAVGACVLSRRCDELERAAKGRQVESMLQLLPQVQEEFEAGHAVLCLPGYRYSAALLSGGHRLGGAGKHRGCFCCVLDRAAVQP